MMRSVPERAVTFECRGDTLVGILHSPAQPVSAVGLLVVVGGPQYRVGSHRQFVLMARELALAGFSVLRFDYRGIGDSTGGSRGFEDVGEDIAAAVGVFLREEPRLRGIILWGLCDGASASLMNCSGDPRVRGLILVNPWVRTPAGEARARIRHYYFRRLLQRSFWRSVLSGDYQLLRSVREFFGSVATARSGSSSTDGRQVASYVERMYAGLRSFGEPVLFLTSERDLIAREFLDLCSRSAEWSALLRRPNVRCTSLAGTDHTFSTRVTLDRAVAECRQWLANVPGQPGADAASGPGLS
jgi:uncharacterized protein